jgi:hypothetical protein
MVLDLSQQTSGQTKFPGQAICGLTPPTVREARIREAWPTLAGVMPPVARLGGGLVRSVILLPLGWLMLAPLFGLKFAPLVCRRYTLTNRRLMIQRGWRPHPVQEVELKEIDEVRLVPDSADSFSFSATLEVLSDGKVVLRLPGVPEPEGFRLAVLNAVRAYAPGRIKGPFQSASEVGKS